MYQKNQNI